MYILKDLLWEVCYHMQQGCALEELGLGPGAAEQDCVYREANQGKCLIRSANNWVMHISQNKRRLKADSPC